MISIETVRDSWECFLPHSLARREFAAFYADPGRGRRLPHPKPGEASKLAPLMEQIRGQEPAKQDLLLDLG